MSKVAVITAKRSPVGKIPGELNYISEIELLSEVFKGVTLGLEEIVIDEAITGSSFPLEKDNLCRKALLKAGLSTRIPASTVSKTCASSDEALNIAYHKIKCQAAKIILVGGCEKVSNSSYILHYMKKNVKHAVKNLLPEFDQIKDNIEENDMVFINEMLSKKYNITKDMQDKYTIDSIEKAVFAQQHGYYEEEIIPIAYNKGGECYYLEKDELLLSKRSVEDIRSAPPMFLQKGTLTQYNAAPICDCSVGILLMDYEEAIRLGLNPLIIIKDVLSTGVGEEQTGEAMTQGILKLLQKNKLMPSEIDLYEINESFAVQAILTARMLNLDMNKVNVNGGNLALGYPIGTTGLRMNVTLIHEMIRRNSRLGISAMCAGGNMADIIVYENVMEV